MANKLKRKVRLNLDGFDPSWKDSYILVTTIGGQESFDVAKASKDLTDEEKVNLNLNIIRDNFVSGEVNGEALTVEDVLNADVGLLTEIIQLISGNDKKK